MVHPTLAPAPGHLPTVKRLEYSVGAEPLADWGHRPRGKRRSLGGLGWFALIKPLLCALPLSKVLEKHKHTRDSICSYKSYGL